MPCVDEMEIPDDIRRELLKMFNQKMVMSSFFFILMSSYYSAMRWMQRLHPGPVHPQSSGTSVAHGMSEMFRLRFAPGRQVLRPRR